MDPSTRTRRRLYLHAASALTEMLLISGIARASTNLLNNGSFETPGVPTGRLSNFTTGSSAITSWTVLGPEAAVVDSKFTSFLIQFPAREGSQWLDLTGFLSSNAGGVEQTVVTVPGKAYHLSFAVGNVFDPRGLYGTKSSVDVTVNGMSLGTFTNSCRTCTKILVWQTFNTSFLASSPTSIIRFMNADPSTDNSNGLDNVVLTEHLEDPPREGPQR
jgi:hypothetical protein